MVGDKRAEGIPEPIVRQLAVSMLDAFEWHAAILDSTGRILAVNAAWRRFAEANGLGASRCGPGVNYLAVCDSATGEESAGSAAAAAGIRRVLSGAAAAFRLEYPCLSRDGQRWFAMRVRAFRHEGATLALVGHKDITERGRAREWLRLQRDLAVALGAVATLEDALPRCLDTALRASGMDAGGIYLYDQATRTINLAWAQGLSDAFVRSVSVYEADSPHVALVARGVPFYGPFPELGMPLDEAKRAEGLRALAVLPMLYEGKIIGCLNVSSHTRDDVPAAVRGILEGIAAQIGGAVSRLQAEGALRDSEARFRTLFEHAPDGIFLTDLEGRLLDANRAAERIVGYPREELLGKCIFKEGLLDAAETAKARRNVAESAAGRPTGPNQYTVTREDGSQVSLEARAFPLKLGAQNVILVIARDITDRKQAEDRMCQMQDQLAHVSRLSTMGEMAAGIAHEVNQPLYSILNFAKACGNVLSAENRPGLEQLRDWTEEIALAAARAGQIVAQLRRFARRSESVRLPASLHEIVDESVQLVASEARRHGADVRLELADFPAAVWVDRIQIQQVMVNLLQNAYEAMDDDHAARRQVTIRTERAGDTVEVSVADTGPGIPTEPGLKIFDAFVTTKPEGLGMGLAISTTIVESHGGRIWAGVNREGGATFHFTLPLV